jgi:hypothetical protein
MMNGIALMIVLLGALSSPADDERLNVFLQKLEHLQSRQKDHPNKWPMPLHEPKAYDNMPMLTPSTVDHDTGLEYNYDRNVIGAPSLQLELDLGTGLISDLKTGKKFAYDELIQSKKLGR